MSTTSKEKIYLIDGSGYIFRAYHALPPLLRPDGTPVGAVYGFTNMLFRLWKTIKNHPLLVVFDASRSTFRQDIYPEYKANRGETPEDLIPQFSIIREACNAFGLPYVEDKRFEADDLIASYAKAYTNIDKNVVIISSDKDLMQLVSKTVSMYDPMKNKPITPSEVVEKFGVPPSKVIDVQALAGDSADNIPGVPGIGVKTAALLIHEFGSLEALLDQAHTIPQTKRREKLMSNRESAEISKRLVTLCDTVPLPININELLPIEDLLTERAQKFLQKQNFTTLIKRFGFEEKKDSIKSTPLLSNKTSNSLEKITVDSLADVSQKSIKFDVEIIISKQKLELWGKDIHYAGQVAIDTETTGLDTQKAELVGISLSIPGKNKAAYIPLLHKIDLLDKSAHNQLPLDQVQSVLAPIFCNPSILKIAHNVKYDQHILARHKLKIIGYTDTMLMSYLASGNTLSNSLDSLAKRYFNYTMASFKDLTKNGRKQKTFDEVPINQAAFYAAEDAFITSQLFLILLPMLPTYKATSIYEKLERPLIDVLFTMEKTGILLDIKHLQNVHQELDKQTKVLESRIFETATVTFNLASPQQLSQVLFETLSITPVGKRGKSGSYKTNAEVLEILSTQGHTIADNILRWRQLVKLQSTYTYALIDQVNPKTKRVHTSYGMVTTSTGRISSSNPNLQNIPIRTKEGRLIRQAFISPKGSSLLSFDYSQIELRLLAHVANIEPLIEAFKNGLDIHAKTASEVLNLPLDQISSDIRRQAKAINFGIIYGISAFGLGKQLGIPAKDAQFYMDAYFKAYPGIQAYMHKTISTAQNQEFVTTLFGRRCYTPDINNKNQRIKKMAERQAINAPLQGTAADIIKKAMIQIHENLASSDIPAKMLLQVHDELIFEVRKENEKELISLVKPIMEKVISLKTPLIVDYGIGPTWDDCH